MKIFDPTNIAPWEPLPVEDILELVDTCNAQRARMNPPRLPMDDAHITRFRKHIARERADMAWMNANTPMGTVFDFLGVSHMVISMPFMERTPNRLSHFYEVKVARPNGAGGIEMTRFTCRDLRAILEPGFVLAA
ncbi:hypothetical protein [Stenotrophomonas phage A1432]|uniref:Uncharacterized protein n=1 Tax=Stenotrophomonas phage A1432 TaxID=2930315 RepID=A0A9E7SQE1_9CAUD|nr:hypothetical protein P9A45_gp79 [Stenotrophomonas phage A1432]UTC27951.1 hypothetical protein [Stenotrophomonas phage A1432]